MKKIEMFDELFDLPVGSIVELRGFECRFDKKEIVVERALAVVCSDTREISDVYFENCVFLSKFEGKRTVRVHICREKYELDSDGRLLTTDFGNEVGYTEDSPTTNKIHGCDSIHLFEGEDVVVLFFKLIGHSRRLEKAVFELRNILGEV